MSSTLDRIKREVKAINELNKTSLVLKFVLVLNISITVLFSYAFFVSMNLPFSLMALFVVAVNSVVMVNAYE